MALVLDGGLPLEAGFDRARGFLTGTFSFTSVCWRFAAGEDARSGEAARLAGWLRDLAAGLEAGLTTAGLKAGLAEAAREDVRFGGIVVCLVCYGIGMKPGRYRYR